MQRQRGELVPIAEALAGLPGPVQTLRKTSPPARRGFTQADQVDRLVWASEATPATAFNTSVSTDPSRSSCTHREKPNSLSATSPA